MILIIEFQFCTQPRRTWTNGLRTNAIMYLLIRTICTSTTGMDISYILRHSNRFTNPQKRWHERVFSCEPQHNQFTRAHKYNTWITSKKKNLSICISSLIEYGIRAFVDYFFFCICSVRHRQISIDRILQIHGRINLIDTIGKWWIRSNDNICIHRQNYRPLGHTPKHIWYTCLRCRTHNRAIVSD